MYLTAKSMSSVKNEATHLIMSTSTGEVRAFLKI
jgi:hypothetical protein